MPQPTTPPAPPDLGPIPRKVRPTLAGIVSRLLFSFLLAIWFLVGAGVLFFAACLSLASFIYTPIPSMITSVESQTDKDKHTHYLIKYTFTDPTGQTHCATQFIDQWQFEQLTKTPQANRQPTVHFTSLPFFQTQHIPAYSTNTPLIAFLWLFFSFWLIGFYLIYRHHHTLYIRTPRLFAHGVPVYATVTRKRIFEPASESSRNTTYYIDCSFTHPVTFKAKSLETKISSSDFFAITEGDQIIVLCHPANPDFFATLDYSGYRIIP